MKQSNILLSLSTPSICFSQLNKNTSKKQYKWINLLNFHSIDYLDENIILIILDFCYNDNLCLTKSKSLNYLNFHIWCFIVYEQCRTSTIHSVKFLLVVLRMGCKGSFIWYHLQSEFNSFLFGIYFSLFLYDRC